MRFGSDTSVLVAGGGAGLGLATAARLLQSGATVVVADLPSSGAEEAVRGLGPGATFVPADVTDEDAVRHAVTRAQEVGELRAAVATAGVATPGALVSSRGPMTLESFRAVMDVNVIGTFNVLRLAADAMRDNESRDGERGVVVCVSSVAAYEPPVGQFAYAVSKAAVAGMTLSAARELARYGVRVVTVAPGFFDTGMFRSVVDAETASSITRELPPARPGKPEEFAALVLHILENRMLNGEVIRLDAGLRLPASFPPSGGASRASV